MANNLGNLIQRTLSFIQKNADAKIPVPGQYAAADIELLDLIESTLPAVRAHLEIQEFHKALEAIIALSNAGNVYIDEQAPWTLKKTDPVRMMTVLYMLCETIRALGLLLLPFMPDAAEKILDAVAVGQGDRTLSSYSAAARLTPGTILAVPVPIFPRYEAKAA